MSPLTLDKLSNIKKKNNFGFTSIIITIIIVVMALHQNEHHCIKSRNFIWFPGVGNLWKRTDSAEFRAIRGNQVKCRDFSQWLSLIFSHSQRNMRTREEPKMWKYIWSTINKRQFHGCIGNRWYQQRKLLKSRTKTFFILSQILFFYHAIWSRSIARKNNFLHSSILFSVN